MHRRRFYSLVDSRRALRSSRAIIATRRADISAIEVNLAKSHLAINATKRTLSRGTETKNRGRIAAGRRSRGN